MRLPLKIEGDRTIWVIVVLLAIISLLSVFSASSNLAYLYDDGQITGIVARHVVHLFLGFSILYIVHRMNYRHFAALSKLMLPLVIILLIYTLSQGQTIGEANASRWIRIPVLGWSFQSSTLASLTLLVYVSRYLAKLHLSAIPKVSIKESFVPLFLPILLVCGLILPANFSTAAILFFMCICLLFLGGFPFKNILIVCGSGLGALAIFILVVLAFPGISNRVETWKSRMETFWEEESEPSYQVEKAKMAIAEGGIFGKGPGKSAYKHFLPQSSSDFIYAVIVEEFGLVGGLALLLIYLILFVRMLMIAHKAESLFGTLLSFSVGFAVIFQAFVNMAVAVNFLPVTGQTLPLVSAGGSSIWVTCLALGIVLSVSRGEPEKPGKEETEVETETDDEGERA